MMDATFWALIALVIFLGVVVYMGVPRTIGAALDKRADGIRNELEEARKLREEARALLAEYQRKRQSAEEEAESIIAQAKSEAERMTEETTQALEELIERRTRAAEVKIAQAESQAMAEVRGSAADVAIAAAEKLVSGSVGGGKSADLIADAITQVKEHLN